MLPFLDLRAANALHAAGFLRDARALFRDAAFIGGPAVETFERAFTAACGARHGLAVSSGTDALRLALAARGIGPGDEVIVPAFTFPGTAGPVLLAGATPVFADVRGTDATLDAHAVARAVTRRTRAVIAVHLFGHAADLGALRDAMGPRVTLIEDAAQAHGGLWRGRPLGGIGDFGCFSFYPTKNLGGAGDGGFVTARTARDATRLRRLRDHGQDRRFHPLEAGFNARLDALQALLLARKLPSLHAGNAKRARLAERYLRGLAALGGHADAPVPLLPESDGRSAWHAFVVRAPRRAALMRALTARGIGHQVYYPAALPDLPAYRAITGSARASSRTSSKRGADAWPVARALARQCLALPLHPDLRARDVDAVVAAVAESLR